MVRLKTEEDIRGIRAAGRVVARVLRELSERAAPGVTLLELDLLAEGIIRSESATPSFLHYRPEGARRAYPASICASVNATIVHGIPSAYALKSGDLLSLDVGVTKGGYIADAATTTAVGPAPEKTKKLIHACWEALYAGTEVCVPGKRIGDIGDAIERVAEKYAFSVAEQLTGHGVGFELHEDPLIYNTGNRNTGTKLVEGMVLAIEPMFTLGSGRVRELSDESFVTADGSIASHVEHTIAVTRDGPRILTVE